MNVMITGGCGQVGSHVAELLLERGDTVIVIDNFATGRREHLKPHAHLTVVEGSIADKSLVERLMVEYKPEVIVHAAAAYKDPDELVYRYYDKLGGWRQHDYGGESS